LLSERADHEHPEKGVLSVEGNVIGAGGGAKRK